MGLPATLKDRLRIWRIIFWRPFSTVVASIYAFLGAAAFVRDNWLPSLQILKYLPSWTLWEWLGVALLGAWIITLEGAHRLASDLEDKLKDKYTRNEVFARLNEFVQSGYQLVAKINDFDDHKVEPIFDLQDEIERWIKDVHAYLKDAFPRYATPFYGDFEKYSQSWERRRMDERERSKIVTTYSFHTQQLRQDLSVLVKEKITLVESITYSL